MTSELGHIKFLDMIEYELYNLTRIRNGKPAASLFKPPRIRRFVEAGILMTGKDRRFYQLTAEARDELDYIRLQLIQGRKRSLKATSSLGDDIKWSSQEEDV